MAERPIYVAQEQIASPGFGRSLPLPKPDTTGETLGTAVAQAGKAIGEAGSILAEVEIRKRRLQASADADAMFIEQAMKADQAMQGLKYGASHQDYSQNVLKALDAFGNEGLKNLKSPLAQFEFKKRFDEFHLTRYNEALKFSNQLFHQYIEGTLANRFTWSMHEAAKLGQNGGFDIIGQAVQDAYNYAAAAPELEATITKATEKFVKDSVGRMVRQDASENPAEFVKSGAARWADRTLSFRDSAGRPHQVVIGADPALITALERSSAARAEHMLNRSHALRNQMDKEMADVVKKAGETRLFERMQELHEHPEKGWTAADESEFAKYAHHDALGVDAVQGLKMKVVAGAVEGISTPGLLNNYLFGITQGTVDEKKIASSNLTTGESYKAMVALRAARREDDISKDPAYKEYEKRVLAEVGGQDAIARSILGSPRPQEQEAVITFWKRMHEPNVTMNDIDRISVEVIRSWKPNWKPGAPIRREPAAAAPHPSEEKKGKGTQVTPEGFSEGQAPKVDLPKVRND